MTGDARNFYLATPLEKFQYLSIPIELIPQEFIDLYHLQDKVKNVFIYYEVTLDMYGLPEAGVLAKENSSKRALKSMTIFK